MDRKTTKAIRRRLRLMLALTMILSFDGSMGKINGLDTSTSTITLDDFSLVQLS